LLLRLLALMAASTDDASRLAAQSQAAALFHVALADALARAAIKAARQLQISAIAFSGGCFFNRILRTRMQDALTQAGLTVHLSLDSAYGDAGLALGQAWVAARSIANCEINNQPTRNSLCV